MKREIFSESVEAVEAWATKRLIPLSKPCCPRIGAMKDKLILPEDLDAPLPDDTLNAFEGTQG
ncbi:hypothetical protein [Pseudomonas sp. B21-053]|uniref:hypothetical protein n=1 Tax=Pseudomonas sp. B21-053 TaxID=2895493 RepID=UPI0022308466|nr:hypothetical protein [Pseudomonas sp. B21-053]UZE09922.1 hypothetical protein LOY68_20700 [Pseudomonas sp. B21-053]